MASEVFSIFCNATFWSGGARGDMRGARGGPPPQANTRSATDHCTAVQGDTRLHITKAVAAQQSRLESSRLSHLECIRGARLSYPHSWHRSPEGASDWRVAALWTSDHRSGHQTVASTSAGMCSRKRRTFWTPAVAEQTEITIPYVLEIFIFQYYISNVYKVDRMTRTGKLN